MRAFKRFLETANSANVRTRDDLESTVDTAVDRRLDLLHHLAERDDILAFEVAAFLRENLIFDLDPRRARAFQDAHRPRHVHRIAEARIGVGKDRYRNRVTDHRHVIRDLAQCDEADVGNAKRHVGNAGAGDVDGLVA